MIAACTPCNGQIAAVLNYLYGYTDEIYISYSSGDLSQSYLYTEATPQVFWYSDQTTPVYLPREGNYTSTPTINIPQSLIDNGHLEQFIADLHLLIPFYVKVVLNPY